MGMSREEQKAAIAELISFHLPRGDGGLSRLLGERIVRLLDDPGDFGVEKEPYVQISARYECPCAAHDVLQHNIMVPFDIDKRAFLAQMEIWWLELKHEVRAHQRRRPAEADLG